MSEAAGLLDLISAIANLGVVAVVMAMATYVFLRLGPRWIDSKNAERESHNQQMMLLLTGFREFGERIADAQQQQAKAMEKIASVQQKSELTMTDRFKVLELATKYNTQLLEQLAARLENRREDHDEA